MRILRVVLMCAIALPAFAQKQEIRELQRDVAMLQDQVRSLDRSFNERVGSITTLLQQAIDSINKLNTTVSVLDAAMRDREKNLATPVTAVGAKVDQMAGEFQYLRNTIDDLNGRIGKLERQLVDMNNALKVIQAPPVAPPAPGPGAGGAGAAGGAACAGASADALYANAMSDKVSGKYEMALGEFHDYLKCYANTDAAPNAQYYIGEISFQQKHYDEALKAFDAVLERFPENNKTLDALFMKGRTLVLLGDRTAGAEQYREVIRRAPTSGLAQKAREQLKTLGLSANARPAQKKTAGRATRKQ